MRIRGIENLSLAEIEAELQAGGRFVFYEFCVSLLVFTLRRPTDIYFLRARQYGLLRGIPYSLISLVAGWWGVPWGLIYTPLCLLTNLTGGRDVTAEVWNVLCEPQAAPPVDARTQACDQA